MKMLRIVAAGALSYFAWRAWQRNREDARPVASRAHALPDEGGRTKPYGDPLLDAEDVETASTPRAAAHSSPGFGAS